MEVWFGRRGVGRICGLGGEGWDEYAVWFGRRGGMEMHSGRSEWEEDVIVQMQLNLLANTKLRKKLLRSLGLEHHIHTQSKKKSLTLIVIKNRPHKKAYYILKMLENIKSLVSWNTCINQQTVFHMLQE